MSTAFDPDTLSALVRQCLEGTVEERIARFTSALSDRYPGLVNEDAPWILSNAGGGMGQMKLLHASLTEYVLLFGTPVGTDGHTGRYVAEEWFFILDGEQWSYEPGELQRRVYGPGDTSRLHRGRAGGYRIPDRLWGVEYVRGAVPLMLPFGLADTLSSTLDFRTLVQTMAVYTRLSTRQALRGKL
jgi:C-8 sterol isomerase